MAANRTYETAYFLEPPAGTGLAWVNRFDETGCLLMEHHLFGESVHGPVVTVDPGVEEKFVRLTRRSEMVPIYGEEQVSAWEERYLAGSNTDLFLEKPSSSASYGCESPFFAEGRWSLPVLRPDYDGAYDNLIIVDATAERHFDEALDELATYGCRYARIIVISQEAFRNEPEKKALYKYPISHLLLLPALEVGGNKIPISMILLPFAMNLVALGMAAAGLQRRAG
jgi:hypothetical protein